MPTTEDFREFKTHKEHNADKRNHQDENQQQNGFAQKRAYAEEGRRATTKDKSRAHKLCSNNFGGYS